MVNVPLALTLFMVMPNMAVPEAEPPELYLAQMFTFPPVTVIVPDALDDAPPETGIVPTRTVLHTPTVHDGHGTCANKTPFTC
jgi:hypothetical protein